MMNIPTLEELDSGAIEAFSIRVVDEGSRRFRFGQVSAMEVPSRVRLSRRVSSLPDLPIPCFLLHPDHNAQGSLRRTFSSSAMTIAFERNTTSGGTLPFSIPSKPGHVRVRSRPATGFERARKPVEKGDPSRRFGKLGKEIDRFRKRSMKGEVPRWRRSMVCALFHPPSRHEKVAIEGIPQMPI